MSKKYKIYQKLDPANREFRVLVLEPATDSTTSIKCSLVTISKEDNTPYLAISYTWGDPTPVKTLALYDQTIRVPYNTWEVLHALRYTDRYRTVWIDSVCINQADLEERASQVKLMSLIYFRASSVRVWLGLPSDDDGSAIDIFKSLSNPNDEAPAVLFGRGDESRQLMCFFSRPWWERIWVIQEVAIGQDVVFQIGNDTLAFEELRHAFKATISYVQKHNYGFEHGSFAGSVHRLIWKLKSALILEDAAALFRKYHNTDMELQSAQDALMRWMAMANTLRNRKATVARDRLYALYGLLPACVLKVPGLQPSYSITTEAAYTEAAYALIETSRSLTSFNLLGRPTSATSNLSLPSWVPDWQLPPTNLWEADMRAEREPLFDASKGSPFYLKRLSGNTICLKGCFMDLIQQWDGCSLAITASPLLETNYQDWRNAWSECAEFSGWGLPPIDDPEMEDMFRKTVLYNCEPSHTDARKLQRSTPTERQAMFEAHERAMAIALGGFDDPPSEEPSAEDALRTDYMMKCADGTFFVTSCMLMGITSARLERGDQIFIVSGNSHPVILRPSKRYADTWTAVGECHITQLVDGDGLQNREEFEAMFERVKNHEDLQDLRRSERNPEWDEVEGECEAPWMWLLIE